MKHVDLLNIKLNHINIFLTTVEYGSFTAAAEKLHMTQPAVSRTITNLEAELGLYLIIRDTHKFRVTPAGKRLYEEWKGILQDFGNSLTSANSIQSGLTDKLMVGFGAMNPDDSVFVQCLKRTREMLPGVDIYLQNDGAGELLDMLLKDELDIIAISKHQLPMIEDTGLEWCTLAETYHTIFVHISSPIYQQEKLEFADLKKEKFIVKSTDRDPMHMQLLTRLAKQAGFVPQVACYVPNEISFKVNLELGNGVVLADSVCQLDGPDIKRFELEERNDIIAVWKPDNYRESIRVFLSFFQ